LQNNRQIQKEKTMKPKLRKVLNTIDNYLATGDKRDSMALWDILAALRGPDKEYPQVNKYYLSMKDVTTSVIRAAAFPKTAEVSHRDGGRVCASMTQDGFDCARVRTDKDFPSDHFTGHAQSAFRALGLDWNHQNKKETTDENS
jgi:hypothetical protein